MEGGGVWSHQPSSKGKCATPSIGTGAGEAGCGAPMTGFGQAWSSRRDNMEMGHFSIIWDAVMETF